MRARTLALVPNYFIVEMKIKVAVDASRTMSGGGKAHILGLVTEGDPVKYGISEVHIWSKKALIDILPNKPWLIKHSHPLLEKSLIHQILWQFLHLPKQIKAKGCDILLSTDAGTVTVCPPSIVMSRDMLSFEKSEIARYKLGYNWLRLFLLRYVQIRSLKKATAALFLTKYAANTIQSWTGAIKKYRIIPHGIGKHFRENIHRVNWPSKNERAIRCLYISNTAMYKHQWQVAEAVAKLRKEGYDLEILFVGGGQGVSQKLLTTTLDKLDPRRDFCKQLPFVPNKKLPELISNADIYIFASSCENMPNTLLEGMARKIPIASSNLGPMPEVLEDGGVYFNPEDYESIASAIKNLIDDEKLRRFVAQRAKDISMKYSWARCANETFSYLVEVTREYKTEKS